MKNSSSDSNVRLERSHRYGTASSNARSKENMPNQDVDNISADADKRAARNKNATVPRPFTFTSRRKQRSTPKHIRFQREALARRAEREANKGTRRTRFF